MRVKWVEQINVPEIYWEEQYDLEETVVHKEGEVVDTVSNFWSTYFVVKMDDGTFDKIDIDDVTAV